MPGQARSTRHLPQFSDARDSAISAFAGGAELRANDPADVGRQRFLAQAMTDIADRLDSANVATPGHAVEDLSGHRVGTVIDVRLVIEGDLTPASRISSALVVSPRTRSSYLGCERTGVKHPVVLQKLLRWRHRGTFVCAWPDVTRVDTDRVTLRKGYTRYSPLLRT